MEFWRQKHPKPPEKDSVPLAIVTRGLLPPRRFSASTDPVFFHVTATSNSGIWNSTTSEIFKKKRKWNLEFNHLGKIQKQKRPIPDSNPRRDLATSSISIHESFQSHPPNPLSIRESFQSHFSIRESFQSHSFEPVSDPRFILVLKLVAHFSNPFSRVVRVLLFRPIYFNSITQVPFQSLSFAGVRRSTYFLRLC
jgi:hypothetical protein